MRTIIEPPENVPSDDGSVAGGWWHDSEEETRIVCDLCPRECHLKPGDRGFCFVRQNVKGEMRLMTYGRSTGFCIDPIEKKPLNHFYPGTSVLSFGTAGCNLGCKFCQNWDISKSREVERLSEYATPEMIAEAARRNGCASVAFTYNDPIIWAEYAIETARACRAAKIKTVAVTAGYISPAAREPFFHAMDAANVDLKAFTEDFYHKITYSHLQPVLDTLHWLKHESDVWFEITNLVIPDANDSPDEIRQMCDWILKSVGPDVPIHFSAFHPDFRMTDQPRTPHETLIRSREIAMQQGLRFVYVGNVNDVANQSTWCPGCGTLLIERNYYQLGQWNLKHSACAKCGEAIPGEFSDQPGTWGSRRLPIRISDYNSSKVQETAMSGMPEQPTNSAPPMTQSAIEQPVIAPGVLKSPELTASQEAAIHRAACETVAAASLRQQPHLTDATLSGAADKIVMGVFVTLKRNGQLRGCIGSLGEPMPLLPALLRSATRTTLEDPRFLPVAPSELAGLTLDVSLLFNFEDIHEIGDARIDAVEVGKHGLKIVQGNASGLLLPVVAIENKWDAGTFLEHVCRKAGLPTNAWRHPDAKLIRFEGRLIDGPFNSDVLAIVKSKSGNDTSHNVPTGKSEIAALKSFITGNILASVRGAVPACFPGTVQDREVNGLAIQLRFSGADSGVVFSRLALRASLPLQMTLLEMTRNVADWLRSRNVNDATLRSIETDVILMNQPVSRRTVADPDLATFDPNLDMMVVTESSNFAWCFDPQQSSQQLLDALRDAIPVQTPDLATVYSLTAICSSSLMQGSHIVRAQIIPAQSAETAHHVRQPALAGRFYPSDSRELQTMVAQCIGDIPGEQQSSPAVMIPHAGLVYSGHIAATVLKQIKIPATCIIIGPKHTRNGVNFAIAPHTAWQIPGAMIAADVELTGSLLRAVTGLQLDAAAHAQEHSIEVELPLLATLAPNTRIVGITVGGLSLNDCLVAGRQLANAIRDLPERPLLIISSDMNHFATDEENRRLDELALQAMESLDPARLFETVRNNQISMCGVLPAIIVMAALRELGQLTSTHRVAYATSADVSGDKSRVVGYAGMRIGE